jgi:hypothetical protein
MPTIELVVGSAPARASIRQFNAKRGKSSQAQNGIRR